MLRTTDLAHLILKDRLVAGAVAVDATVGNGHDTQLLAQLVGDSGQVFGFDIQARAIEATTKRVRGLAQVMLFHAGHERLAELLPASVQHNLSAVTFNLGYLPGASKDVVTRTQTTIAALEQALAHLVVGGVVTMVVYPGHAEGAIEAEALRSFARKLSSQFAASWFARSNGAAAAPELVVIERLV
ncbi:MAG: class I SAM-dependent methyltransferase [Hyphomicrobiaceae bacterium]|nr:class I SAM-dependent methyltransferase [Hyphomicrobiaceae bacterium]